MSNSPAKPSIGSTLPSVKYPLLLNILHEIADGKTPKEACDDNGTTVAVLRHHLEKDEELRALFDNALDIGSDVLADMLVNIDRVHSNPAMASVISRNVMWVLERRKPERFGARVQVSMENNTTKVLLAALDLARQRVPEATVKPPTITDATYEVVERTKKRPAGFATPPASVKTPQLAAPPLCSEDDLRDLGLA